MSFYSEFPIPLWRAINYLPNVMPKKAAELFKNVEPADDGKYYILGVGYTEIEYKEICHSEYSVTWDKPLWYLTSSKGMADIYNLYIKGLLPMKKGTKPSEPKRDYYDMLERLQQYEIRQTKRLEFNKMVEYYASHIDELKEDIFDYEFGFKNLLVEVLTLVSPSDESICIDGIVINRTVEYHESSDLRHSNPRAIGEDYYRYCYKWTGSNGKTRMHYKIK